MTRSDVVTEDEPPERTSDRTGSSLSRAPRRRRLAGLLHREEHRLGAADLPGMLSGQLRGDCAEGIACNIKYESVAAAGDSDALVAILDEETRRMRDREQVDR